MSDSRGDSPAVLPPLGVCGYTLAASCSVQAAVLLLLTGLKFNWLLAAVANVSASLSDSWEDEFTVYSLHSLLFLSKLLFSFPFYQEDLRDSLP